VILGCFSPQDDATVKCWGQNTYGILGLGDTSARGDDANGPCPPSSTTASLVPASGVLTLAPSCAEMGENLTSVDLGPGRTAVAVSAGTSHTCALLVRLPSWKLGGGDLQNKTIRPHTLKALCCRSSAAATD